MRRFLIKLVLFILPILVIAYPIDVFISKNLYRSGSFFGDVPELKEIHEGSINAEILIIGSSRAEVHFDSRVIMRETNKKTYNIGLSGADWNLIKHRLDTYLEFNQPPDYLIVNIDVGTFSVFTPKYKVRPPLLPYMLYDKRTYGVYDVPFEDFAFPLVRYIGNRKVIFDALTLWWQGKIKPTEKHFGFRAVDEPFDDTKIDFFKRKDFTYLDIPPSEFYNYIETTLPKTKIIGVHTPIFIDSLSSMNLENIRTNCFRDEFEKRNWVFLDYSKSEISLDISNFYNSIHMNVAGVNKFMDLFIKDLDRTGIIQN